MDIVIKSVLSVGNYNDMQIMWHFDSGEEKLEDQEDKRQE